MDRAIPLTVLVSVLAVFWLWMYRDMANTDDLPRWMFWDVAGVDNLPNRRLNWTLAFVLLNVFTAAIYYAAVYRQRY